MQKRLVYSIGLVALFALQSCGSLPYMRKPEANEPMLTAPPAGQALVNFHRPSGYGGAQQYPVFDGEKLIGNTMGKTMFQYVCDPGVHHFMGVADRATVVRAELAADKVYDIVLNISMGFWKAGITMDPLIQGHDKRPEVPEWEERERRWIYAADERALRYEASRQGWAQDTKADFTTGDKQDRLKSMGPNDDR